MGKWISLFLLTLGFSLNAAEDTEKAIKSSSSTITTPPSSTSSPSKSTPSSTTPPKNY